MKEELRTERLLLREPTIGDLDDWHRLKSDTQNMRFLEHLQTHSLEESRADLQRVIVRHAQPQRDTYFFVMCERQSGAFLGSIGFMTEPVAEGILAGAGWFLLPEHQGKGYATEAFRALIPFGFANCGVTIFDAGCNAANHASERVMIKCDMRRVREGGERLGYQLRKDEYYQLSHQ